MQDNYIVMMFVGFLLSIFMLYYFLTWGSVSNSKGSDTLMHISTQTHSIRGVEVERRSTCPRAAQEILRQLVVDRRLRACLHRDGPSWVVSGGNGLSVRVVSTQSQPQTFVYYMRQNPPILHQSEAAASTTTDAVSVRDMVTIPRSAIRPTALAIDKDPAITRFPTLDAAWLAWPAVDAPNEKTFLYANGRNDPAYYIVRTLASATDAVVSDPTLQGTVYTRKSVGQSP